MNLNAACVPIHREDNNQNAYFNCSATPQTVQQLLNKDMMTNESKPRSSKAKQTVLDLTYVVKITLLEKSKLFWIQHP